MELVGLIGLLFGVALLGIIFLMWLSPFWRTKEVIADHTHATSSHTHAIPSLTAAAEDSATSNVGGSHSHQAKE